MKTEKESEDKNVSQPPTPTTPEVVSVLPAEKRNEYKKLKLQLALKEQRKGLVASRKDNLNNGTAMNDDVATKQAQEKKQLVKQNVQKRKQPLSTLSFNRQMEIQTQEQQKLLQLQKQQQQQQNRRQQHEQWQQNQQHRQQQETEQPQQKQDEMNQQRQQRGKYLNILFLSYNSPSVIVM